MCQYSNYKCVNTADTLIINVTEAGIADLCDQNKPIIGDVWTCDAITVDNFPATATISSSRISFATDAAGLIGGVMYLQWTTGIMVVLGLGILCFLLFMKRR